MNYPIIPQDIRRAAQEKVRGVSRVLNTPPPKQIEKGQIWSTRARFALPGGQNFETKDPRLVVIIDGPGQRSDSMEHVIGAPVSLAISMATEFDLIVAEDASPLGFRFLVEVWNETPALKGHLKEFLGRLSSEATMALEKLYQAKIIDDEVPASLAKWVGPQIMREVDPRLIFQRAEVAAVSYLAQAATAALGVAEVYQPVREQSVASVSHRVFSLQPILTRLSDIVGSPRVAYAAGSGEQDTYVIAQREGDYSFTFELLSEPFQPYNVYLIVHQLARILQGRMCTVTIETPEQTLRSVQTELRVDGQIQIGQDAKFRPQNARVVTIEFA